MGILALATPIVIAASCLLLFGLLVILRLAIALVREAKELKQAASTASARLRTASREVEGEAKRASERAERIGRAGRNSRSRGGKV